MTAGRPVDDVLAAVRRAVADVLEVDPAAVTSASRLREDLRADSLALLEVVEILERRLAAPGEAGPRVDDEELDGLRTAGDLVELVQQRTGDR